MRRAPVHASAEATEEAFYDAMRRGDTDALMALWADDEEVACTHPNGARLVGLVAIRASFEQIFSGGGVAVQAIDRRVHESGLLSVHHLIEQLAVTGQGGAQLVECVATNVFVKTLAGWRMVLHHASPLGEQAAPAQAGSAPTVLH
jgi:ketosteroid isomerase-like protein